MNRLDRLTATLTQLQSKKWVKAQEMAERFDITLRTVYRDIRSLEEAGVPIVSEAGRGYSLVDGYRLPPIMFTREEAVTFILAGKLLSSISDRESGLHFNSALYKIKSVLREPEKELLEQVSSKIVVPDKQDRLDANASINSLHPILETLTQKRVLQIDYCTFDKEEITTRKVEPVGIYYSYEQWYLIAWCRLRKAYRTFRLDRAKAVTPTGETYTDHHPSLKAYLEQEKEKHQLFKVVLLVPVSEAKYLLVQKYNHGFVMEKTTGNHVEMTFMTSSLEGFVRWMIMLGDFVSIQEPQQLKEMLKELLQKMLNRIG